MILFIIVMMLPGTIVCALNLLIQKMVQIVEVQGVDTMLMVAANTLNLLEMREHINIV